MAEEKPKIETKEKIEATTAGVKKEIVIDATNATLGRLASYAAKQSLLGKSVIIVNCNDAVITGKPKVTTKKYARLVRKGGSSLKGPKIARTPYRIVKRTIRGMLSHNQVRGRDALKRIICHNEVPAEFDQAKMIKAGKPKLTKTIKLKDLIKGL